MRAIVIHKAKDLRIEERSIVEPSHDEVLVTMATGGICGSDLHYYNHGGIGDSIRLKEPMILGHEVAGYVTQIGPSVTHLKEGDLVAVSPSRPCYNCQYCARGQLNHCENMRFYGSAMPFPHIQGAFREQLVAKASQCIKADGLSAGEAAMAEPSSVCLHAVRRAGELLGKRVLITGSGPIGTLCVLAAKAAGAGEIVITDLVDRALEFASSVGADHVINMGSNPDGLKSYQEGKGTFDILFECSGAAPALAEGIKAMRPRGVVMQLGLGGDMNVPVQALTAKELDLRGSFRFHEEFNIAVDLMQRGVIDVKPLISHTVSLEDAERGFELAMDRSSAMKTQIAFA
ncbi:MAG: L-idonate 5-dehydrogenase [Pseudomonadota bacterium]